MVRNKNKVTHYTWGNLCDGWPLLELKSWSIKEERMPPASSEIEHIHKVAAQFFFILRGKATMEVNGQEFILEERDGIFIPPNLKHCIKNKANTPLEFLVISNPGVGTDRFETPFDPPKSLNLHGKKFMALANSNNGEVSAETIFSYRQEGDIVWATYRGGDILFGTLSGRIEANKLNFTYQHQNMSGDFMTGKCKTTMERVKGKIRLYEQWEWTCKDHSKGESILEEISAPIPYN